MGVSSLHLLDWLVLLSTLLFIVLYGVYKTRKMNNGVEDYIKGGKDTKWWTIGLSVMATQASAITFLSLQVRLSMMKWALFSSILDFR